MKSFRNWSKKAQMEMVGLVIIVILITVGMIFLAQFALKEEPSKKIFTRKGLAYSTMSAILKTTVIGENCAGEQGIPINPKLGEDLLEDCANNFNAPYLSLYQCGGKPSCDFVKEFVTELLNETLGQWNKNYEFNVVLIPAEGEKSIPLIGPITGKSGVCPKNKDRDSSGPFPIHTEAGLVQGELYLCD